MHIAAIIILLALTCIQQTEPGDYRWKHRLLIIAGPEATTPKDSQQYLSFLEEAASNTEHHLILVYLSGPRLYIDKVGTFNHAAKWRTYFDIAPGFKGVVLVGKDGGKKLETRSRVTPESIYDLIDSMPMRQQEMKKGN